MNSDMKMLLVSSSVLILDYRRSQTWTLNARSEIRNDFVWRMEARPERSGWERDSATLTLVLVPFFAQTLRQRQRPYTAAEDDLAPQASR